jgi:transposase
MSLDNIYFKRSSEVARHLINLCAKLLSDQGGPAPRRMRLLSKNWPQTYKWCHPVENFFCDLKQLCRFATRYDKSNASFAAMIHLGGSLFALK